MKSSAFERTHFGGRWCSRGIPLHTVNNSTWGAHISLFTFVSRSGIIHKCLLLNHGNVLSRSIWHLHRCCSTSLPSSPLKSNTVQWNVNTFCRNVFKFNSESVALGCTAGTSGGDNPVTSLRDICKRKTFLHAKRTETDNVWSFSAILTYQLLFSLSEKLFNFKMRGSRCLSSNAPAMARGFFVFAVRFLAGFAKADSMRVKQTRSSVNPL